MSIIYIHTQGACLRRNGGRLVVTKGADELASVPQAAVDGVVILGNVQITAQAVASLLEAGVLVVYLSMRGQFRGLLQPGYPKNVFVRLAQYEASHDEAFSMETARAILRSKLASMEAAQNRWRHNAWTDDARASKVMNLLKRGLDTSVSLDRLRALEGRAARVHFAVWGSALPPAWNWSGRHRQPPPDPVNALLSLAYILATGECVVACYGAGLDPFVGFLHQLDYGRPSLALDLLEPLRHAWCEHFVLRCLQREEFSADDFHYDNDGSCRLNPESFRRFLGAFEFMAVATGSETGLRAAAAALAQETARAVRARKPPRLNLCTGSA